MNNIIHLKIIIHDVPKSTRFEVYSFILLLIFGCADKIIEILTFIFILLLFFFFLLTNGII